MESTAILVGVGPRLGEAAARRLVEAGYRVGLIARSAAHVEALAAELGDAATAATADATDPEALAAAFETIRATHGPAEALVYNASAPGGSPLEEASSEAFEAVWRTRALGLFNALQAASDPRGVVVSGTNFASAGAPEQIEWGSAAAATKGLARSVGADSTTAVTYVEIAAAIAPPDSAFGGAVNAAALADQYVEFLDREPGFYVETVRPE
jgi:NADP-dependent 3-hydroxy acid dehydrogenase YdfG